MQPAPPPPANATADQLTQYRLSMIEDTLKAMTENLERLVALEQKHLETREALGRAFDTVEKMDGRVHSIELEMPTLKLVRKWVMAGVVGILSLLGLTVFKLFTITIH